MSKTLLVAEKPSVGKDLQRALPGPFEKHEGYTEGPEHVITWAIGHLLTLAAPEAYGKQFKSWKMETLPIVPDDFKLEVRDDKRSRDQMKVIAKLMARDDVDLIVNACDAGREGELIFAYTYEYAGAEKPVQRLWLSSMTNAAIKSALDSLRPASDYERLEQAARSRSEADWIVGMNATRAATIRLRSSFDGAVSLGRVQTPTLAIVTRREEEIRAFKPEAYWLVDARFRADEDGARAYVGHYQAPTGSPALRKGESRQRLFDEELAQAVVLACSGQGAVVTKLEKKERREAPKPLYDLTSLQREANSRYGFSARRTLAAAQRLYEEHKALTYPRTNSKFLTSDMVEDIVPTVELLGAQESFRAASEYVAGLAELPLERVINDEKVGDHHAIIPTRAEHNIEKIAKKSTDDLRIYEMVVRRFLAVFHPEAVFEDTKIETTIESGAEQYIFKASGKVLIEPGWRAVYEQQSDGDEDDEDADQQLPRLSEGESVTTEQVEAIRKETKPPRRFTDASLLGAMEGAGKELTEDALREAMGDQGIGTPATRASIIERLIDVGYIERDGRALVATEKGLNVIRLLNDHALTSPKLTGEWEQRLARIESGEEERSAFMTDIAKFAGETVHQLDETLKDVRIPRAKLGPCPVCGREIVENRKGYSCWSRDDAGCGFVIWKDKAGKTLPVQVARELIRQGYTERAVTGFRSRNGRSFRAHLALSQTEEGRWRVEFDELWAREGAKPPDAAEADSTNAQADVAAA